MLMQIGEIKMILSEVIDDPSLSTKEEIFKEVMKRGRGWLNPHLVKEEIDRMVDKTNLV